MKRLRQVALLAGALAAFAPAPGSLAATPPERVVATVRVAQPLATADTATLRLSSTKTIARVKIATNGGAKRSITVRLAAGKARTVDVSRLLRDPKVRGLRVLTRVKGVVITGTRRPRLVIKRATGPVVPPVDPPAKDTTAPSAPGAITTTSTTRTSVTVSWAPATDNVGVVGYQVTLELAAPVTLTTTTFAQAGLECGKAYRVTVTARDAAGNVSPASTGTPSTAACPVIAAVGDIACDPSEAGFNFGQGVLTPAPRCRQLHVANAVRSINPDVFLMLGDAQYSEATTLKLNASYGPAFADLLPKTRAVQGNHDFNQEVITTPAALATDFLNYFGAAARPAGLTYYSFDLDTWHIVVLNSNCSTNAVNAPSCATQTTWLQADLAATTKPCIAAAWHHPRWSSFPSQAGNPYADNPAVGPWVQALYNKGADVVLSGHAHHYERLGPLNPSEQFDTTRGMMFWVSGAGGRDLRNPTAIRASSVTRQFSTFGPLKLTLGTRSYDWQFVPEAGGAPFTDAGSRACNPKS